MNTKVIKLSNKPNSNTKFINSLMVKGNWIKTQCLKYISENSGKLRRT